MEENDLLVEAQNRVLRGKKWLSFKRKKKKPVFLSREGARQLMKFLKNRRRALVKRGGEKKMPFLCRSCRKRYEGMQKSLPCYWRCWPDRTKKGRILKGGGGKEPHWQGKGGRWEQSTDRTEGATMQWPTSFGKMIKGELPRGGGKGKESTTSF